MNDEGSLPRSSAPEVGYREALDQAQVLAYADEFRLFAILALLPFMRPVEPTSSATAPRSAEEAAAPVVE